MNTKETDPFAGLKNLIWIINTCFIYIGFAIAVVILLLNSKSIATYKLKPNNCNVMSYITYSSPQLPDGYSRSNNQNCVIHFVSNRNDYNAQLTYDGTYYGYDNKDFIVVYPATHIFRIAIYQSTTLHPNDKVYFDLLKGDELYYYSLDQKNPEEEKLFQEIP